MGHVLARLMLGRLSQSEPISSLDEEKNIFGE